MHRCGIILVTVALSGCASVLGRQAQAPCADFCTIVIANTGDIGLNIEARVRNLRPSNQHDLGSVHAGGVLRVSLPEPPARLVGVYTPLNDTGRYTTICRFEGRLQDELRYSCGARGSARTQNTSSTGLRPAIPRRPLHPPIPPAGIPDSIG